MKKTVVYARFSSDNQRKESIDEQVRACRYYAQQTTAEERWKRYVGSLRSSPILQSCRGISRSRSFRSLYGGYMCITMTVPMAVTR